MRSLTRKWRNASSQIESNYIKEVIIWGDDEHVAGLAIMNSRGEKEYFGSNYRDGVEFEHNKFYLHDINRLIGAFGLVR